MTTITKTHNTITEKGIEINITVVAKRGYENVISNVWVDQPIVINKKSEINETIITMVTMGKTLVGSFSVLTAEIQKKYGFYAAFTSRVGNIGVTMMEYNDIMNFISSVKKEAELDANWIEYKNMENEAIRMDAEYEKNAKAIEKMMTLNGHTY